MTFRTRGGIRAPSRPRRPVPSPSVHAPRQDLRSGTARDRRSALGRPSMVTLQLVITGAGVLVLHSADENRIGKWGLIQALPVAYWPLVLATSVIFARHLRAPEERVPELLLSCVSLVVFLHTAPALVESLPRFSTAWNHVGMVEQIQHHHVLLTWLDARFNWAGFFVGAASVIGAMHADNLSLVLKAAPTIAVVSYIPPSLLIARSVLAGWRRQWTAVWLVLLLDWVGQDYFAPQTFTFALYLYCLSIVLYVLRLPTGQGRVRKLLNRSRLPGAATIGRVRGRDWPGPPGPEIAVARRAIPVVCVAIGAIAMSHQLTPFVLIADLIVLSILGGRLVQRLQVFAALASLGWISFGAYIFWTGHMDMMLGGVGQVDQVVGSSVVARFSGDSVRHTVLNVRTGLSLTVWGLAYLGLAVGLRCRRGSSLTLGGLLTVPFLMFGAQSYGGEGALRVFLFSLPPAACAIAFLMPAGWLTRLPGAAAVVLVSTLALVPFLVARYGNEDFERARQGDADAIAAFYRVARPGATAVSISPQLPWRYKHVYGYEYLYFGDERFALSSPAEIRYWYPDNPEGNFLVVTTSQLRFAEEVTGVPRDMLDASLQRLRRSPMFHIVYQNADAVIFRYGNHSRAV
jgi:hypothetical protein